MDFQALLAALTKLKVDLATLRTDIGTATYSAVFADAIQAASDAHDIIGMILPFLATWFMQPHAKTFSAHAPMASIDDADAILDHHIAAVQAGAIDPTKLISFLLQLVPLLLSLFAKPAPTP